MSFFVVGARTKIMSFNKHQKNQTEIDRENVVAMLQVHHVQSISEGIFDARSALFDGNSAVVHLHARTKY